MTDSVTVIRRFLSNTPLAKRYDEILLGSGRTRRSIPWSRFDRGSHHKAALDLAADAHTRLAEGEYYAVGLFGRIASGVALAAAPFDLVATATRISSDEIRHADYCTRFASLCVGSDVELSIQRSALEAAAPELPGVEEVDFLVAKYAATGETLAAALLLACRKRARDPVARALFRSLLGDEVVHARFGWYYLHWRAPQWTRAERQVIADRLGEFVADIEQSLWFGRDAPEAARASADALGVLDSETQRGVVKEVMEEEIVPALDAVGLGASHAWKARKRGGAEAIPVRREGLVFAGPRDPTRRPGRAADRAAQWLASQVQADGSLTFSVDVRTGAREAIGPLYHGRAAIVLRALEAHGGHLDAARRLRTRLRADIGDALNGTPPPGWPDDAALVAATLALSLLAGLAEVEGPLLELAGRPDVVRTPWYAAEVATALGRKTPSAAWNACVAGLDGDPWAPWTALAARARGDSAVAERVERELVASVAEHGAATGPGGREVARTAVVVEALAPFASAAARDAASRAVGFLHRVQLSELGEPDHAGSIDGAFPLTDESDVLRADVTAHALLALLDAALAGLTES
jgi:hypothetical protein